MSNNEKHLPEEIAELRNYLQGNEAFGRIRGKCGYLFSRFSSDILDDGMSPSQTVKQYDQFVSDMRIFLRKLAVFKRDNKMEAYRHLEKALVSSNYVLPWETYPVEETSPLTLLMFEPEKTLFMVKWIMNCSWMDLDRYLEDPEKFKQYLGDEEVRKTRRFTARLFEEFPRLEEFSRIRKRRREYEGWELLAAHTEEAISSFADLPDDLYGMSVAMGTFNDHLEVTSRHHTIAKPSEDEEISIGDQFLFAFEGEPGEVLSHFSRDEQERIATWYMEPPRRLLEPSDFDYRDLAHLHIGLHLEGEHEEFQEQYPALSSNSASHGLGAVLLEHKEMKESYNTAGPGQDYFRADPFRMVFTHRSRL